MAEEQHHYSGAEFEALAAAHNYYGWILRLFGDRLRGSVVEVGAGRGNFSARLLAGAPIDRLMLIEPSQNLLPMLRARFAGEARVEVREGYFGADVDAEPFDAIVLVNVLEHIEDDAALVRDAWAKLRPGGALLLFVPALPILFGSLDRAFGHHRRYTRAGLRGLLGSAGFRLERLRFVNSPGVIMWFIAGRILRQQTLRPAQVRLYDRLFIPWVRLLESMVAPPFAQSLLAVATKPPAS